MPLEHFYKIIFKIIMLSLAFKRKLPFYEWTTMNLWAVELWLENRLGRTCDGGSIVQV
jgi:hypothetical protein